MSISSDVWNCTEPLGAIFVWQAHGRVTPTKVFFMMTGIDPISGRICQKFVLKRIVHSISTGRRHGCGKWPVLLQDSPVVEEPHISHISARYIPWTDI